jgi:hypothetical protein
MMLTQLICCRAISWGAVRSITKTPHRNAYLVFALVISRSSASQKLITSKRSKKRKISDRSWQEVSSFFSYLGPFVHYIQRPLHPVSGSVLRISQLVRQCCAFFNRLIYTRLRKTFGYILGNTQGIISTFGWLQVDGVKTKWQPADLFALDSHCC